MLLCECFPRDHSDLSLPLYTMSGLNPLNPREGGMYAPMGRGSLWTGFGDLWPEG